MCILGVYTAHFGECQAVVAINSSGCVWVSAGDVRFLLSVMIGLRSSMPLSFPLQPLGIALFD